MILSLVSRMIRIYCMIVMFTCYQEISSVDPCLEYIELNDTALTTTNIPPDVSSITCPTFTPFKWYRYTGTDDGLLTNQCPTGLQCGSHTQIWINDSFPTLNDDIRLAQVCIHTKNSCCAFTNKIQMKNCTSFMVYLLVPLSLPCANYCFLKNGTPAFYNAESRTNVTPEVNKTSLMIPVAIMVVLLSVIGIIITVLLYKRNKYRKTHSSADLKTYANCEERGVVARNKFNPENLNSQSVN